MSHNTGRNSYLELVGKTRPKPQRQKTKQFSTFAALYHVRKFLKMVMFRLHPRTTKSSSWWGRKVRLCRVFFCINIPGNSICIEMVINHWSRKQTSNIPVFPEKYRVPLQKAQLLISCAAYN